MENLNKFIYSKNEAINEAKRCLNCKNKPCIDGCPAKNNIPEFIKKIAEEKFEQAKKIISKTNSLPGICGKVCPHEIQCQNKCTRKFKGKALEIGKLESFVTYFNCELNKKNHFIKKTKNYKKKVAIIGSGPSGLSCAKELALKGIHVTIFDSMPLLGGMLTYGIPAYRLPREIIHYEIEILRSLGVKFITKTKNKKNINFNEMKKNKKFDAFFICTGAWAPKKIEISGENLPNVFSGTKFLRQFNSGMFKHENFNKKNLSVIGGGNVAIDSARCAKQLGSNVTVFYRQNEEKMPAWQDEIKFAKAEGINFKFQMIPKNIIKNKNKTLKVTFFKKTNKKEEKNKKIVDETETQIIYSETQIETNFLIYAIGQTVDPNTAEIFENLLLDKNGCILIEKETGKTSIDGIFAGGDVVTGPETVVLAMISGKNVSDVILQYLE
ncbi:MAG: FAD-dependent oxidoreductase [Clostridiales bacterium]|jgi:glutamate synthase (NADPH/NADH) small chain|nr:FAD-dependent oxidoreductase [Clostridiales bacterium]